MTRPAIEFLLRSARRVSIRFIIENAIVAIAALMLVAISFNAWSASEQRKHAESWYVHTLDVLLATSNLKTAIHAELRGERGYLLTHNDRFLDPYRSGHRATPILAAELRRLTRDNPEQQRSLDRLDGQIARYEDLLRVTIALEATGRHDKAIAIVRAGLGKHHIDLVLTTIAQMESRERAFLVARRARADVALTRNNLYQYSLSAVGFLLLALTCWAGLVARRAHGEATAATEELRLHATTDALTGLANRRHFLAALDTEVIASPTGPVALAIIDVDFFKAVNDNYGHPAGDKVLREIADLARGAVRATDLVGRMGGEEFAILMPGATVEQAKIVCDRLNEMVRDNHVVLDNGRQVRVTLSAGIALRHWNEKADDMICRADRALYDAKRTGRDRVLLAA